MKRKIQLLAVAFALVFLFAACSGTTEKDDSKDSADVGTGEVVVMKVGHSQSTESARHLSLLEFEKLAEAYSNGGIDVQIFPSGQLGNEQEMVEAVKLGVLQGARAGMFDLVSKQLSIYMMPFLFDNVEEFQAITRGPIGEKIAATANEVGIEIVATGDAGGFRQWTNNERPIKTPEDMKGLKMRAPGVQTIIDSMTAFGANVVSIPYVEVYQALKTGVADGEENPFVNIEDMKFYEVQKYMTICDYQVHPDPFYVNQEWLEGLSDANEKAIRDAAMAMVIISDQMYTARAMSARATIENAGVEVYELTPEEKQVFIDAAQTVYDKYTSEGLIDEELFNEVLAALGK
jgi:C4-dicarboxylate-binding protein DctP